MATCTSSTGPTPKRPKFSPHFSTISDVDAWKILRCAQEQLFPWQQCMPQKIADWFTTVAKAHNTLPEFMFVTALSTTAALMGPQSQISVREPYSEPPNLFTVCLGPPGSGKSQAFRLSIIDPLGQGGWS